MGWVGAASGRLPLWLEGRCASYASSTPYGAYQQLLCRFIGAPLEAGEAVLRPALESAVRAVLGNDSDLLPVLAHMMGMAPGPGGAHLGRMGPAELQQVTFAAVRSLLAKLVSRGPTVLALEDLHWSDPTSLHLTQELSSLAMHGPLLLVLTRRPEPDLGVSALEAALIGDGGLKCSHYRACPLGPSRRAGARPRPTRRDCPRPRRRCGERRDRREPPVPGRALGFSAGHTRVGQHRGGWMADRPGHPSRAPRCDRAARTLASRPPWSRSPRRYRSCLSAGAEFALGALAAVSRPRQEPGARSLRAVQRGTAGRSAQVPRDPTTASGTP